MAIYNKRVGFTREQLIEQKEGRNSLTYFIYGIVRFIGIIIQNIYCVSSYLVLTWIILFPISWIRSDLYSRAENCLYNWLLFIVSSWSMAAGIMVVETGDEYKYLIEESENLSGTNFPPTSLNDDNNNNIITNNNDSGNDIQLTSSNVIATRKNLMTNSTGDQIINSKSLKNDDTEKYLNEYNQEESLNIADFTITMNYNNKPMMNKVTTNEKPQSNFNTNQYSISNMNKSSLINHRKTPKVLLLCNHISTADVPLIMQSFSTLTKQSLLWVLDAQFKPTNFGLVCSSHGDFFIAKNSFTDGSLKDQVLKHPDRNLIVLFPEGGFWRKRFDGSIRYASKNNLPVTQYVTHPRFGAFKDLIDPKVEITHIVDATLFYDDIRNPLSILDIALGNRKETAILHYKVYKRDEINPTEEWLRCLWIEKDKLLQQYYEDRGKIYKQFEKTMRCSKLDWFKVCAVHLFYLFVCYLTIYRLFIVTSVTMLRARDLYYSKDI